MQNAECEMREPAKKAGGLPGTGNGERDGKKTAAGVGIRGAEAASLAGGGGPRNLPRRGM